LGAEAQSETNTVSPLRQRMIEDMAARKLNPHTQRIALAAQPLPNFPRLRALALFGRRPPECEAPLVMPASKNLHRSSHRVGAGLGRGPRLRNCSTRGR
jgi:hypothetical protein